MKIHTSKKRIIINYNIDREGRIIKKNIELIKIDVYNSMSGSYIGNSEVAYILYSTHKQLI